MKELNPFPMMVSLLDTRMLPYMALTGNSQILLLS